MKSPYLKITGLILLTALGFLGVLVCSLIYFADPDPPSVALLATIGAGSAVAFAVGLPFSIRAIRNYTKQRIDEFENKPDEVLGEWSIPVEQWRDLVKYEAEQNKETGPGLGGCVGSIFGFVFILGYREEIGWSKAILFGLGITIGLGLIIAAIFYVFAVIHKGMRLKQTDPEVAIRIDGMLINRKKLVTWGMFGVSLKGAEVQKPDELKFPIFVITISQYNGNSQSSYFYRVPIPESELNRAERIVKVLNAAYK